MGETESRTKRWYDSAKMIWALFGLIACLIGGMASAVYGIAVSAQSKNADQDVRIEKLDNNYQALDKRTERMDAKLDRILERVPAPK